jgi:hypothetical protein
VNELRPGGCPELADLLLAQEGELPRHLQAAIARHLRRCVACQAMLAETEGLLDRVRRVTMQSGSGGNSDDEREARVQRFLVRLHAHRQQRIHQPTGWPARRWVAVAAMAALILVFLFSESHSVVVEADELLRQAAHAELTQPAGFARRVHLALMPPGNTAIARIGVPSYTADQEMTDGIVLRSTSATPVSAPATLMRALAEHHFIWQQPLSAICFNAWRTALSSKQDHVRTITAAGSSVHVLRTSTVADGHLREVELTIDIGSHRVLREVFVFDDLGTFEIEASPAWIRAAAPATVAPARTRAAALITRTPASRPRVEPLAAAARPAQPDLASWLDRRFGDAAVRAEFMPKLRRLTATVGQQLNALQDLPSHYPGADGPQASPIAVNRLHRQLDRDYQKLRDDLNTLRAGMLALTPGTSDTTRQPWVKPAKQEGAPTDWSRRVDAGRPHAVMLDRLAGQLRAYDDLPPDMARQLSETFDALWSAIYAPSLASQAAAPR